MRRALKILLISGVFMVLVQQRLGHLSPVWQALQLVRGERSARPRTGRLACAHRLGVGSDGNLPGRGFGRLPFAGGRCGAMAWTHERDR
jgi:hypothetical protein